MNTIISFFRVHAQPVRTFTVACLYAAVCMPLVVGSGFLFPFVFPKALFFEAVVEIALVAYLGLVSVNRSFLPRMHAVLVAVCLWIGAIVLTSFTGVDASFSFWSKAERMDGVFWYLHLAAFFVMVCALLSKREQWIKFLQFNAIVSWVVGLVALASKFAPSLAALGDQSRLAGTFGNPAFLATYFLVMLFAQTFLALPKKQGTMRWFWIAGSVFSLLLVFLSGTRGAYVGILAGICVTFFAMLIASKGGLRKIAVLGFIGLAVFVLSFIALRPVWERVSPFLASRVYSIWEIPKPRLIVWQIGRDAFLERPIFGWGMENFLYAFDKHFIPDLHTYEMSLFDRPHNKIIDLATSQGMVGLGAYLGIFAVIGVLILKRLLDRTANPERVKEYAIFIGLCAAYFVQDLVLFEMPSSGVMLFMLFAMAYWLLREDGQTVTQSSAGFSHAGWLLAGGAGILALSFWNGIVLPAQSGNLIVKAALGMHAQAGAPSAVLSQSKQTYDRARGNDTYLNKEIDVAMDRRLNDYARTDSRIAQTTQYRDLAEDIMRYLKQDMAAYPLDYDVSLEYGVALFELQQRAGVTSFEGTDAKTVLQNTIMLAPKREDAYQYLFLLGMQQGDREGAQKYADILTGLNSRMGLFWFYQAEYEARWGTHESAYAMLDRANQNGFDMRQDAAQWLQLANSFALGNKYQDAMQEYRLMTTTHGLAGGAVFQAYFHLIELQKKTGDSAGAHQTVQELLARTQESDRAGLIEYMKNKGVWQ